MFHNSGKFLAQQQVTVVISKEVRTNNKVGTFLLALTITAALSRSIPNVYLSMF